MNMDLYYEQLQEKVVRTAWHNCKYMQQMAIIPKGSKTKVGACVLGRCGATDKFFMGCNIVISTSHIYHAEIVALMACLAENYKPVEVFVTSRSEEENIHCCLDCRARLLECNPEITYTVFNPNGDVKQHGYIIEDCKNIMEDKSGKMDLDLSLHAREVYDEAFKIADACGYMISIEDGHIVLHGADNEKVDIKFTSSGKIINVKRAQYSDDGKILKPWHDVEIGSYKSIYEVDIKTPKEIKTH